VEWNNLAELVAERVASFTQQAGRDPPPELASNIDKLNRSVGRIAQIYDQKLRES
jgi:hypothetical protein